MKEPLDDVVDEVREVGSFKCERESRTISKGISTLKLLRKKDCQRWKSFKKNLLIFASIIVIPLKMMRAEMDDVSK